MICDVTRAKQHLNKVNYPKKTGCLITPPRSTALYVAPDRYTL